MKILFSSFYHPKFENMSNYIERTLRFMGFDVGTFDWYNFITPGRLRNHLPFLQRLEIKWINNKLVRNVKNYAPDILLVAGGFTITPDTIYKIKSQSDVIAVNWVADYPRHFDLQIKNSVNYDYFFVSGTDALAAYQKFGRENGYWLPFACDPEIHRPIDLTEKENRKYK